MIRRSLGMALAVFLLAATSLQAAPVEVQQVIPISFKSGLAAGRYAFSFGLYDEASGGALVWEETPSAKIAVAADGVVNHRLGSANSFTNGTAGAVNFGKQLWVEPSRGSRKYPRFMLPVTFSFSSAGLRFTPNPKGSPNAVGGHFDNRVSEGCEGQTIAGGGSEDDGGAHLTYNAVAGCFGTISGGKGNRATYYGVIAGGRNNTHEPGTYFSVIGGGEENRVSADYGLVAGGGGNSVSAEYGLVAGGGGNRSTADRATILGGSGNLASGSHAVVAGGCSNTALGERSFVAGEDGNASRYGMFVWSAADSRGDPTDDLYEDGTGFPAAMLKDAEGNETIENPLLADQQFWAKAPGGFFLVTGLDGTMAPVGVKLAPGSQSWEPITPPVSDVNLKRDFAGIDGRTVLERVAALPLSTWSFRSDRTASRHLGPMAHDFSAAFGLGADDRHIDPQDGAGVSLAAIQGLYALTIELQERVAMQERELAARREETTALRARVEDLSRHYAELRRLLAGSPDPGSDLAVK